MEPVGNIKNIEAYSFCSRDSYHALHKNGAYDLLWPINLFNISFKRKNCPLNIFERTILSFIDIEITNESELSKLLSIDKNIVHGFILSLMDKGFINKNNCISSEGKKFLQNKEDAFLNHKMSSDDIHNKLYNSYVKDKNIFSKLDITDNENVYVAQDIFTEKVFSWVLNDDIVSLKFREDNKFEKTFKYLDNSSNSTSPYDQKQQEEYILFSNANIIFPNQKDFGYVNFTKELENISSSINLETIINAISCNYKNTKGFFSSIDDYIRTGVNFYKNIENVYILPPKLCLMHVIVKEIENNLLVFDPNVYDQDYSRASSELLSKALENQPIRNKLLLKLKEVKASKESVDNNIIKNSQYNEQFKEHHMQHSFGLKNLKPSEEVISGLSKGKVAQSIHDQDNNLKDIKSQTNKFRYINSEDQDISKSELKFEDQEILKPELKFEDQEMSKLELNFEDQEMSKPELKFEEQKISKPEQKLEDMGNFNRNNINKENLMSLAIEEQIILDTKQSSEHLVTSNNDILNANQQSIDSFDDGYNFNNIEAGSSIYSKVRNNSFDVMRKCIFKLQKQYFGRYNNIFWIIDVLQDILADFNKLPKGFDEENQKDNYIEDLLNLIPKIYKFNAFYLASFYQTFSEKFAPNIDKNYLSSILDNLLKDKIISYKTFQFFKNLNENSDPFYQNLFYFIRYDYIKNNGEILKSLQADFSNNVSLDYSDESIIDILLQSKGFRNKFKHTNTISIDIPIRDLNNQLYNIFILDVFLMIHNKLDFDINGYSISKEKQKYENKLSYALEKIKDTKHPLNNMFSRFFERFDKTIQEYLYQKNKSSILLTKVIFPIDRFYVDWQDNFADIISFIIKSPANKKINSISDNIKKSVTERLVDKQIHKEDLKSIVSISPSNIDNLLKSIDEFRQNKTQKISVKSLNVALLGLIDSIDDSALELLPKSVVSHMLYLIDNREHDNVKDLNQEEGEQCINASIDTFCNLLNFLNKVFCKSY